MTEEIVYLDFNKKYNCDVNLCLEDILNFKHCLYRIQEEMKLEYGCDLFTFTIKDIISRWEKTIGKKVEDCK